MPCAGASGTVTLPSQRLSSTVYTQSQLQLSASLPQISLTLTRRADGVTSGAEATEATPVLTLKLSGVRANVR